MAFLENAFALLNTDGDDTKLLTPVAAPSAKAEKKPGDNKKNNNKQKPTQTPAAQNVSGGAATPIRPRSGPSEYGRIVYRGSEWHNNANGSNTFYNGQNGAPQRNNGQGSGYRRYDGQANGDKQYGGHGDAYQQYKEGNINNKFNIQFGSSHELNSIGDYSQYIRYEKNGSETQEWREHGGDNRREFNKIPEANQQVGMQGQEKLAAKGEEHKVENEGWNLVGDRRGNSKRGNSPSIGAISRVKGEASVYNAKEESLNGEAKDCDVKSTTTEGGESNGVPNETDPRQIQRKHKQVTEGIQSNDLNKEEKVREPYVPNFTLDQYESYLIQKKKSLEALKQEERKVTADKDFKLAKLIGRKKEDFATKLNSEKDGAEEEKSIEMEVIQKKPTNMAASLVRDVLSFPIYRRNFESNGGGRGGRGQQEGGSRGGYRRDFEREGRGRGGRGEVDERGQGGYRRDFERNGRYGEANGAKAATSAAGESKANVSHPLSIDIKDNVLFPDLCAVREAPKAPKA